MYIKWISSIVSTQKDEQIVEPRSHAFRLHMLFHVCNIDGRIKCQYSSGGSDYIINKLQPGINQDSWLTAVPGVYKLQTLSLVRPKPTPGPGSLS